MDIYSHFERISFDIYLDVAIKALLIAFDFIFTYILFSLSDNHQLIICQPFAPWYIYCFVCLTNWTLEMIRNWDFGWWPKIERKNLCVVELSLHKMELKKKHRMFDLKTNPNILDYKRFSRRDLLSYPPAIIYMVFYNSTVSSSFS